MTTLILSKELLNVLVVIKDKKALCISESMLNVLGEKEDWYRELRRYFYHLPRSIFERTGLQRNELCFRSICHLTIPKDWLETESDRLAQFSFSF